MKKMLSLFVAVLLLMMTVVPAAADMQLLSQRSMLIFMTNGGYYTTGEWIKSDDARAVLVGSMMVDLASKYQYETIAKASVQTVGNVYVAKDAKPDTLYVYFYSWTQGLLIVEYNTSIQSVNMTVISDATSADLGVMLAAHDEYWVVEKDLIKEKYSAAQQLQWLMFR